MLRQRSEQETTDARPQVATGVDEASRRACGAPRSDVEHDRAADQRIGPEKKQTRGSDGEERRLWVIDTAVREDENGGDEKGQRCCDHRGAPPRSETIAQAPGEERAHESSRRKDGALDERAGHSAAVATPEISEEHRYPGGKSGAHERQQKGERDRNPKGGDTEEPRQPPREGFVPRQGLPGGVVFISARPPMQVVPRPRLVQRAAGRLPCPREHGECDHTDDREQRWIDGEKRAPTEAHAEQRSTKK
jgi:hypothetical protein